MNKKTTDSIKEILTQKMDQLLKRRIETEPFNEKELATSNPFGYRLAPIEVWKGSKFERSLVTTLGQGIFEQVARVIAEGNGDYAENQLKLKKIEIDSGRKSMVDTILKEQREIAKKNKKTKKTILNTSWSDELRRILDATNNKTEEVDIIFDLYIKRKNGTEEFYSMKTVKPNLDQTQIAKKDILYIKAIKTDSHPYFALPYNPAGDDANYRKVHSIPYHLINMDDTNCVLIGSRFWNQIGQDDQTYNQLLNIFEEVGKLYSSPIKKDYFNL